MKKIFYILVLIGLISLTIPAVQAEIIVKIDIQDSFGLGETMSYNYTLISDSNTQATIIPHIECSSAPVAPFAEKTIVLEKNVPYEGVYYDVVVEDIFETQTCIAYIQVISPVQQREEKTFAINTNPEFSFLIDICRDQACTEKSKIFFLNENIFLGYDSDTSDLLVIATLSYPEKIIEEISLPSSIMAEQIGTYTLEVTASKQGYKTITKKEQFAVIDSEAEIQEASQHNNDEPEFIENYKTRTQSCSDESCRLSADMIGILLLAVIAIGLMLVYCYSNRRARKAEELPRS